jgi:hypothetical protein
LCVLDYNEKQEVMRGKYPYFPSLTGGRGLNVSTSLNAEVCRDRSLDVGMHITAQNSIVKPTIYLELLLLSPNFRFG